MKAQKGFIQIPILIIAIIVIAASSVGVGVVLHRQEKLPPISADISEAVEQNKEIITVKDEEIKGEELQNEQEPKLEDEPTKEKVAQQEIDEDEIIQQEQKLAEKTETEPEIQSIQEETAEPEFIPKIEEAETTPKVEEPIESDPCTDINCPNCQYCDSGICVNYCQETDINCGCASCNNCNNSDGCSGNNYLDYYCLGNSCVYNSDDCSDCSCFCGGYNTGESIKNGNCEDGKDNDCDGSVDLNDSNCQEGTEIKGIISENTVWSIENSPYVITDDVLIAKGVKLEIGPSVVVKFQKGKGRSNMGGFEILIKGNIVAKGTPQDRIVFTSFESNPQLGDWGTIEIVNGGSINFNNVEIKYASYGINAANPSSVVIANSYFSDCGTGIFVTGPATISNNIIENNYSGIIYCGCTYSGRDDGTFSYFGIRKTEITHNIIRNNIGQGLINPYHAGVVFQDIGSSNFSLNLSYNNIYNNGSGIKITNSNFSESLLIKNNNIYNHSDYNVWIGSKGSEVNMPNNWWGTTNTDIIDSKIYDCHDNYIVPLPEFNYQPITTSEIQDAGVQ